MSHNVVERKKTSKPITQKCLLCNKRFPKTRKDRIYCSTYCKFKNWALRNPRIKIQKVSNV